jgi:hypothetical protein
MKMRFRVPMSANRTKATIAKPRFGFMRADWHQLVDPAFLRYWSDKKKSRRFPGRRRAQEMDKATAKLDSSVWGVLQSAILRPLDIELNAKDRPHRISPGHDEAIELPENPESSPIFRKLVFLKHGITFRELIWQLSQFDVDKIKSVAAHKKLMSVHRDYWRLQTGGRFGDLKLKFAFDHFDLISSGLDFGLNRLDPYELAECLDEICYCGRAKHSATYVKKLRSRITKEWKRMLDAGQGSHSGARYPL